MIGYKELPRSGLSLFPQWLSVLDRYVIGMTQEVPCDETVFNRCYMREWLSFLQGIDALSMAALLANIKKLYLPHEMLTKHTPLTGDEERVLQPHVMHTADILKALDFDGPVVQIIEQQSEWLVGRGYPAGLTADSIMQEEKIITVAKTFVEMSSARAYRPGLPVNKVMNALLEQAGLTFDRYVIAALFHIAEKISDWKNWQTVKMS